MTRDELVQERGCHLFAPYRQKKTATAAIG